MLQDQESQTERLRILDLGSDDAGLDPMWQWSDEQPDGSNTPSLKMLHMNCSLDTKLSHAWILSR